MEHSPSSTDEVYPDTVAKRTRELLVEIEGRHKKTGSMANLILIIGRTGAGKSSLLEDLTNSSGRSRQSTESVTQTFELEKAAIGGNEYFFMDTPGFDPENEHEAFRKIVGGIQATRRFARITGLLYLTCINQPRFDDFNRKLVRFVHALCGNQYAPRITFVTTFWTAASARQQATFYQTLEDLRVHWLKALDRQQPISYEHGREYDADGQDDGAILDWFENREKIAQHGKAMITRRYGEPDCMITPRIVQELDDNTPIQDTAAGKLLGMAPAPSPRASNGPSHSHPMGSPPPRADSDPGTGKEAPSTGASATGSGHAQQQPGPRQMPHPESETPSWNSVGFVANKVFDLIHTVAQNTSFDVNPGNTGRGPPFRMGNAYRGPLDPRSSVDVMKSFGLDSSREGRLRYAAKHGIGGEPFSASWGNAMGRHVSQNHGQ